MKSEGFTYKPIKPEVHSLNSKPFIPWEYQSMLDDQSFDKKKTKNLDDANERVDLIHDDWFGLAPLATPESLSEVSSISSRASSVIIHHDKNGAIKDRWLPTFSHKRRHSNGYKTVREHDHERSIKSQFPLKSRHYDNSDSSDSYLDSPPVHRNPVHLKSFPSIDSRKSSSGESSFLNYGINSPDHEFQIHATQKSPRVIRRTPKIPKGLATAYEDSDNNQRFEEMMKTRFENLENTSNETNSFISAKSQDLEKSSVDSFVTPVSSSRDSIGMKNEEYFTPEKVLEKFDDDRGGDSGKGLNRSSIERQTDEDINYHKPTTVILPTDESFSSILFDRDVSQCQYPYLETDFSLSDPDLTLCDSKDKKPVRKIKFDTNVRSGVSFDQDYEFDIETESARLIDSNDTSEVSLCRVKRLPAQDSCYKDDDSVDETVKPDSYLISKDEKTDLKSSQNLLSVEDSKSHYYSRSAEALPLLTNIAQNCPEKKRKYSFSFLTVNKGESSV